MNRSKLSVICIFGVAALLAAGAWLYRVELGDEALDYWGTPAAFRIRHARLVEAYQVVQAAEGMPASHDGILELDGQLYRLVNKRDISSTRGIINARQALIEDASFGDFGALTAASSPPHWRFALRFVENGATSTVLFDASVCRLRLVSKSATAAIDPISSGMKRFLDEQFAPD